MSTTSIYRLGREPSAIGEVSNAWRGAMYVWNDIAKRYCGLERFPFFPGPDQERVWNAYKNTRMPRHEAIVLLSTMDGATVRGEDLAIVAEAFEKYGAEHPNSSLTEQAAVLRRADIRPGDLIAWQQTSVGEFWGRAGYDEDGEEPVWYDSADGNLHFDACADAALPPQEPRDG